MGLTNAQIAALKTELQTDPATLGYNSSQRNDQAMADAINLVRSGTAADGKSYSIFRTDIKPSEVVNAIAAVDFTAATALQIAKLQLLFVGNVVDATLANVRTNFLNIFSGASAGTITALTAVASRNGSRAEVLFGVGVRVSIDDVGKALN